MKTRAVRKTGSPQRVGTYIRGTTEDEKGGIFVGYTKCEHCTVDLKVIMFVDEARHIADIVGTTVNQRSARVKFAKRVQKWAESAIMAEAARG